MPTLAIEIDRNAAASVGEQIYTSLRQAIIDGRVQPGRRLPSGRDLAAQLGVARGTILVAYERLASEKLVFGAGPAGTRVCAHLPPSPTATEIPLDGPLDAFTRPYSSAPLPFQMGVPAHDAFPAKLWARMRARAVRADATGYTTYADPRGERDLRAQIASHLAISRQIQCHPDQVIVTSGYRQGLMLTLIALRAHGRTAWIEEPGYPLGRKALELAGLTVAPISVDMEGLRVEEGIARAPHALLALVTPGQHAPLGVALSPVRRRALLEWAEAKDAWIIEDDYLGELQLVGRAAPALAAGNVQVLNQPLAVASGLVLGQSSTRRALVKVECSTLRDPSRDNRIVLLREMSIEQVDDSIEPGRPRIWHIGFARQNRPKQPTVIGVAHRDAQGRR